MNLSYDLLREKVETFNRIPHDETDFHRLRELLGVELVTKPLYRAGYYVSDAETILLDERLSGYRKTEVQFHELTHAILDHPCEFLTAYQERRAEAFALMFLIPLPMLWEYMNTPVEELNPELLPYLIRRLRVFKHYGK